MRILGMISGTSHDGIDLALVDFHNQAGKLSGTILGSGCVPYHPELRSRLVAAFPPNPTTLAEVCELDTLIGQEFAAAASQFMVDYGQADAICSHGQTVFHWVDGQRALGTLQLGQPAWIAERTGCLVVSDIRIRDITVGGQGAPLASFIDYLLLRSRGRASAALNLGGISNMTVVSDRGVVGFDIGPANALIDAAVVSFGLNDLGYDADAAIARQGTIDQVLLSALLTDPYYKLPIPKTTGKEYFNEAYLTEHLRVQGRQIPAPDLLATLAEVTVRTVADAVRQARVDFLAVSGGGSHNPLIMDGLRRELPEVDVQVSDVLGVPADSKEAILMALIGWCTLHGVPAIVEGGTGSSHPRVLGCVTPGRGGFTWPKPVSQIDSLSFTDATGVVLRAARDADLEGIVAVFLDCWRISYRDVLPSSVKDAMTDDRALALWQRLISSEPESIQVAVRDGEIVGMTRYVVDGDEGMVHSLYVSPKAQRLGLGTRLLDHAWSFFADRGCSIARLWVFVSNQAGIGFYREQGWAPDGQTRVELEFGEPELRLWRSV